MNLNSRIFSRVRAAAGPLCRRCATEFWLWPMRHHHAKLGGSGSPKAVIDIGELPRGGSNRSPERGHFHGSSVTRPEGSTAIQMPRRLIAIPGMGDSSVAEAAGAFAKEDRGRPGWSRLLACF